MDIRTLFEISLPIIQAPMAGSQNHQLAAAVSNAGGLGSVPAGMLNAETLDAELTAIATLTRKPYNVNFFCHQTCSEIFRNLLEKIKDFPDIFCGMSPTEVFKLEQNKHF